MKFSSRNFLQGSEKLLDTSKNSAEMNLLYMVGIALTWNALQEPGWYQRVIGDEIFY